MAGDIELLGKMVTQMGANVREVKEMIIRQRAKYWTNTEMLSKKKRTRGGRKKKRLMVKKRVSGLHDERRKCSQTTADQVRTQSESICRVCAARSASIMRRDKHRITA